MTRPPLQTFSPRPALAGLVVVAMLAVGCADGAPSDTTPPTSPPPVEAATPSPTHAPTSSPTSEPSPSPSPTPSPEEAQPPPADTRYASAAEIADVIVQAERTIRSDGVSAEALEAWAWAQQAAYRQLAAEPAWHDEVLAAVPAELVDAVRRNLDATLELRALTAPREELPGHWRIIAPPPAEELLDHYQRAADEFGIDWTYLAAIHLVETRMGRIRGDSTAGARGPMQFLPATWEAYGQGDIEDYGDAIRAAAYYLADHGAPEDMDGALWAYNHSDHYVRAIQHYAANMREDLGAYHAYYHWQVYYRLVSGDVLLPVGWGGP